MEERALNVLEYDQVVRSLVEQANTTIGKEKAAQVKPMTDIDEIAYNQQITTEARRVIQGQTELSMGGIKDVRQSLKRAKIGASLEAEGLLDMADTLAAGRRIKKTFQALELKPDKLMRIADSIGLFQTIEDTIYRSIDDNGEVKDGASPALQKIRRQMQAMNERIRNKLESFIRSSEYQKIIQEAIITQREGRFVIPVKQEYKGRFPGIVHDQSASGATLFIEPKAVVEANSELRQLKRQEKQEIDKILAELSKLIQARLNKIEETVEALGDIDTALAKAKLSQRMNAWEPEISRESKTDLKKARHPLLKEEVVPIDIRIGMDFDILVITGPNTGGKTVALKTLGLLVLMAQAGLHIPADPGSAVGIFCSVLPDIGDEQSIEQNLSTFSGHMKNIIAILEKANENTLVLLDEIGAGTDPAEGAALAMAILEHLQLKGAKTAATTHYSELKAFAYNQERVENASVEFDVETLQPTFKVTLGLPGHSNAFAIAKRLGLDQEIIDTAKEKVAGETQKTDEMIRSVASMQSQLETDRIDSERAKGRIKTWESKLKEREEKLARQEKEILEKAREEAASVVTRVRKEADELIRQLRKSERIDSKKEREKLFKEAKERFDELSNEVDAVSKKQPVFHCNQIENISEEDMVAGKTVFIKSIGQKAEIIGKGNHPSEMEVQIGQMKVMVGKDDLFKIDEEETKEKRNKQRKFSAAAAADIPTEIDLRGLNMEEASAELDSYIDKALLGSVTSFLIIHGKGTGILRKGVHEYLERSDYIQSFRLGEMGEGGDGVTIAELKV